MHKTRKRRKGGGRKFADKRISKVQTIRSLRQWFMWNTSVKGFLMKRGISRQAYYRLLANNNSLKVEITRRRLDMLTFQKEEFRKKLAWLRENPDKHIYDYSLRDLSFPEIEINFVPGVKINV